MDEARGESTPEGECDKTQRVPDRELEDIVAEYLFRREEGDDPTVEEYQARFPGYAEDIAYLLAEDNEPGALLRRAGGASAAAGAPDEGSGIGRYEFLERIAIGGGGTVFRARHRETGQIAAVKVLDDIHLRADAERERFFREVEILRGMDLVGVVPILEAGEAEGRFYMATRWIDGSTLAGQIAEIRRCGAEGAPHPLSTYGARARLVARIAGTFEAVHRAGILHRDIKPTNILVDRVGEPVVIDFGIARLARAGEITATGDGPMGTPRYLSPELISRGNREFSERSDVYGLGLCLYELATLDRAFPQATWEELYPCIAIRGPLPPRRVQRGIPPSLEAIILRATERDPRHRYPSMEVLAADLLRFAEGRPVERKTLARARPLRRLAIRHPALIRLALLLLILCLGGAYLLMDRAARRERIEILRGELAPWLFIPAELMNESPSAALRAAGELREMGDSDPLLPLRAAWIAYAEGRLEDARAIAGMPAAGEPEALSEFRVWLNFRLGLALDSIEAIPAASTVGGGMDLIDLRGTRRDWSDDAERMRARLTPPGLSRVREEYLPRLSPAPGTAAGWTLRALVLAEALPGDLDGDEGRDAIAAIEHASERALALDPGSEPALWVRSLVAVRYGEPSRALEDLRRLEARRPGCPAVPYLLGVALADGRVGGGEEALGCFQRAGRLASRVRGARPGLTGATAFDDQAWRKLFLAWGLCAIDLGRPRDAEEALSAWAEVLPVEGGGFWQDRVFHGLLDALRLEAEGRVQDAIECLDAAAAIHPDLALPLLEKARMFRRQGLDGEAEEALGHAQRKPLRMPRTLEEFAAAGFFGLRPFCATTRFLAPGFDKPNPPR